MQICYWSGPGVAWVPLPDLAFNFKDFIQFLSPSRACKLLKTLETGNYLRDSSGLLIIYTFIFNLNLSTGISIGFFLLLKTWTASSTSDGQRSIETKLDILAAFAGANMIFAIVRSFYFFWIATNSSKHLHDKMLKAVLRAPVRFFDTNPYGGIQNRFSKDVAVMDDFLPRHLEMVMILGTFFIGTLLLISISEPWLILGTIPYVLITVYVGSKGVTSGREIKRTEAITNTVVYEHLSDCIQGVVCIRAYGMEKAFNEIHHRSVLVLADQSTKPYSCFQLRKKNSIKMPSGFICSKGFVVLAPYCRDFSDSQRAKSHLFRQFLLVR